CLGAPLEADPHLAVRKIGEQEGLGDRDPRRPLAVDHGAVLVDAVAGDGDRGPGLARPWSRHTWEDGRAGWRRGVDGPRDLGRVVEGLPVPGEVDADHA